MSSLSLLLAVIGCNIFFVTMPASTNLIPGDLKGFLTKEFEASIKCLHLNVRSAKNKYPELEVLLGEFGFSFGFIVL